MTHLTFLSNLIRRYDTLSSSALRYFKVQKCYVVDLETHILLIRAMFYAEYVYTENCTNSLAM